MPDKCCVPACKSNYGGTGVYVSVFAFPKDGALKEAWTRNISRKDFVPTKRSVVCEKHFADDAVVRFDQLPVASGEVLQIRRDRPKLIAGAIPTMFPGRKQCPKCKKDALPEKVGSVGNSKSLQRQIANGTLLPDVPQGESSANGRKEELAAGSSSQPDASASVGEESALTVSEEPPLKVAKVLKPKVDKVAMPPIIKVPIPPPLIDLPKTSLNIDEPRQRKAAQPFPKFSDYVFEGKRMVNMGYFIKSLKTLNDHNGRKCNFSDMRVCKEAKDGWNVGIMFTCNLCPTTKVIWMEDPTTKETPPMPIIFKPKAVIKTFPGQPMKPPVLLQASATTVAKTKKPTAKAKVPVPLPPPAPQKRPRQPYRSKRKTPTPPPDENPPLQQISNYPKTLIIRPNTAIHYGPPQNPFTGQLLVQPVIGQQVPTTAQSQPVISQPQVHVIGQAQLIRQEQDSVVPQSQVPLVDFPQVTSIKQELILPDDGTSPSLINSSLEHARVEMTFCVDQDENTVESGNVPSETHSTMDVTGDITVTRNASANTQALHQVQNQSTSSTSMDGNVPRDNAVTGTLPVDLNLVKKEVDDDESL